MLAFSGVAQAKSFSCHGHKATIVGTNHADVIRGTNHRDVIVGRAGNDRQRRRARQRR
jgi:hypothetical protein